MSLFYPGDIQLRIRFQLHNWISLWFIIYVFLFTQSPFQILDNHILLFRDMAPTILEIEYVLLSHNCDTTVVFPFLLFPSFIVSNLVCLVEPKRFLVWWQDYSFYKIMCSEHKIWSFLFNVSDNGYSWGPI